MRIVTGAEEAVQRLWNPGSIAVIGASSRPGTLPWWPLHLIRQYGYAGPIYPVNPNRAEIDGVACLPSVEELPPGVDLAVVVLNAQATAEAVRSCAKAGVRTVVLPAQGFGELGETGRALEREMLEVARAHGMRIVGPNTDGAANLERGSLATIQPLFGQGFPVGRVAVVTQSGASAGSLIARLAREGIGCRLYASAGNEIDLGLADYLSVAVQDHGVDLVLSFVESIRRPQDFIAVAELAGELGKPIVLIKVGRTQQAAARAAAHTGALAGADRIYEAMFRSLGIIRVDELGELVAIAKLYLNLGLPASTRIGLMSVSGGQAGALADAAVRSGLELPPIADETAARLTELLPFGTAMNPCDLTGDVATRFDLAAEVYRAFDRDPNIDLVVYGRKELTGEAGRASAAQLAQAVTEGTTRLAVYAMDGAVNEDEQQAYQRAGVPIFHTARDLFVAVRRLRRFADRQPWPRPSGEPVARLEPGPAGVVPDAQAKELLARYGIATPREAVVPDASSIVDVGYPCVVKVLSERLPHKTEVGGVVVGLRSAEEVRAAVEAIGQRARAALGGDDPEGYLIQQQIVGGVELIVGAVVDEQFGPFVLVGSGGVLTELLDDVVLVPAPVTEEQARAMLARLRSYRLLTGFRGGAPADIDAAARLVAATSRLVADNADSIAEMDLNPVIVQPDGAVAVDVLITRKEPR
jgi:Acyl-CoA synthetase (NDP forming)